MQNIYEYDQIVENEKFNQTKDLKRELKEMNYQLNEKDKQQDRMSREISDMGEELDK